MSYQQRFRKNPQSYLGRPRVRSTVSQLGLHLSLREIFWSTVRVGVPPTLPSGGYASHSLRRVSACAHLNCRGSSTGCPRAASRGQARASPQRPASSTTSDGLSVRVGCGRRMMVGGFLPTSAPASRELHRFLARFSRSSDDSADALDRRTLYVCKHMRIAVRCGGAAVAQQTTDQQQ